MQTQKMRCQDFTDGVIIAGAQLGGSDDGPVRDDIIALVLVLIS